MYDIDLIKENLTPIQIIRYYGLNYEERGKNTFILCPTHEKILGSQDMHMSNCIIGKDFKSGFHCFACGGRGNSFDLISHINNFNSNSDFKKILDEAYKILKDDDINVEIINKSEIALKIEEKNKIREKLKDKIKLSDFQLQTLGFCLTSVSEYRECFSENIDDKLIKEVDLNNFDINNLNKVYFSDINFSNVYINKLLINNYEVYIEIIKRRCKFLINKYEEKINKVKKELEVIKNEKIQLNLKKNLIKLETELIDIQNINNLIKNK